MSNYALNIQLKEGDPVAFHAFFKTIFPRLIGYCSLFVRDSAQAEDLVQECFLKFWEKREAINLHRSVESLLFVMLRNKCLNHLRDAKLLKENTSILAFDENELQYLYQLDFMEKEELSLEEQLIQSMKEAINKLPEKRQLVFKKAKIEGYKNHEVANELCISVKAVEKHLHQAKDQIRSELIAKFPLLSTFIWFLLN